MILHYKITIKKLSEEGKNFKWGPCDCTRCNRKMWGHGYVARYFSGISDSVYLKRYRCPDCGCVISAKPEGYLPHIRSSIFSIYSALQARIANGHWPPQFPRQRGGHWLRRFTINARMSCQTNLIGFLDRCFEKELHFFA